MSLNITDFLYFPLSLIFLQLKVTATTLFRKLIGLSQQVDELKGLQEEFNNLVLDIYLNSSSQIFHTKLYGFKTNNETYTWLVGSANLSFGGFENNEEMNLTVESISNIERGIHGPKFDNLEKIANILKIKVEELFQFDDLIV